MATRSTSSPLDAHSSPTAGASNGKAIAALIVGIIALIGVIIPIVGVILGIVAIVLGSGARKAQNRPWQATAGFWLGIVAVTLAAAFWILGTVVALS